MPNYFSQSKGLACGGIRGGAKLTGNRARAALALQSRCTRAPVCVVSGGGGGGSGFAIDARELRVSLGPTGRRLAVLKGVQLQAGRGSFHMLLGPNGCGKSTLLRTLGGLIEAESGTLKVAQPTSFVFQNPDHQVIMPTVRADVAFGLGRYSDMSQEEVAVKVKQALDAVNLGELADSPTRNLSGGQKQRVAIASALVDRPQVLLLDELTTYLDEADQRAVLEAVAQIVKGPRAVTALWVTHRLEELRYADTASYMQDGVVKVSGSPRKVIEHLRAAGASV
uniref:ABC transporter domain-containing protein n=1 Tax=Tetraselmis chuii TaxID=63592 RepID=A0A7S1SJU2_9CHLO|mmetsp:Transcript_15915/g.28268  ORF Transcript_15915/g.28268 Transcript_15915/m.28268 type:complete len:281 (+) Transcript_15915:97-939(+)|eukprot:CAMPEP_0177769596 /NCGR_PEP_ID=MMETSP0491_2-20121128/10417_1 /TAXON_ID=63592 /ORGANISM="Tetraselmis chuii, Strain PLY429" /LENGTH=280 /DNA_ID=CAMNT_0019286637 /DNA_START=84 /DNA_END=926 /DNA_ORIENTATION=+